jgi:hypothetical protein
MGDMLKQQEMFSKLGATSLKDYQKRASVMAETIEGQKKLVSLLGEEEYSRVMNQTATEKIASFIDKIKESFANLLGNSSFKSFIDKIIGFISDPKNIEALLSKITGFISTMIHAVAYVLDGLDQLPFVEIDKGIRAGIHGYANELSSLKIGALAPAGLSVGTNQANSTIGSNNSSIPNTNTAPAPDMRMAPMIIQNNVVVKDTKQDAEARLTTSPNSDHGTSILQKK